MPTVGLDLFFNPLLQPATGLSDDELGVLLAQRAIAGVALQRLAQRGQFLRTHVTGVVLAVLPDLQFEIGASVRSATRTPDEDASQPGNGSCPLSIEHLSFLISVSPIADGKCSI